jgi:hypothetical protein
VPYNPLKGKFAKIAFTGSPEVVLPAINWTLPIDGNAQDASNFRDGRKVMVTLDGAEATFTIVLDADALPTESANGNVKTGVEVTGRFYVDNLASPARFYAAPLMITRTEVVNEGPTGRVLINVTAGLNGDITYPVVSGGGGG